MSDIQQPNKPLSPKKVRKARAQKSLRRLNLDLLYRKFGTVLTREADALLVLSYSQKLNRDESDSLSKYLRLIKEMRKLEKEEAQGLSEEELAKLGE